MIATHPVALDTLTGSGMDLVIFLDMYGNELTLVMLNKLLPHPLLIVSQSDYLIQIVDTNSHAE